MLDYLINLFLSLGTLGNIALCFSLFLVVALTWSFSVGHRVWGLMTLLSLIFFTIIIYKIPGQYLWFRPIPVIFLAAYIGYQSLYFYPFRHQFYELVRAEVARRKPTLLRDNLLIRVPARYQDIPVWVVPALVAIILAGIVGAGFVSKTNEMAASNNSKAQAYRESKKATDKLSERQLAFEQRINREQDALRTTNDSLATVIEAYQFNAATATHEARLARQKAEILFQANKRRIEKLEMDKTRPNYDPIRRSTYEPSAIADSTLYAHVPAEIEPDTMMENY